MHDDLTQYGIPDSYLPSDGRVDSGEMARAYDSMKPRWTPVEAWAGGRPPVSKWAPVAARLRRNYGAWMLVETPDKSKAARNKFAGQVRAGEFPAFDPAYFDARVQGGEVFMRFTRPGEGVA